LWLLFGYQLKREVVDELHGSKWGRIFIALRVNARQPRISRSLGDIPQDLDPEAVAGFFWGVLQLVVRAEKVLGLSVGIECSPSHIPSASAQVKPVVPEDVEHLQRGSVQRASHRHEDALLEEG